MSRHLYLIRHAETAWSLTGQHTGRTDLPLTVNGQGQALHLGPRLSGVTFDRVLSSPLQRARLTCHLAAFEGIPEIDPDLAEWNYGSYEGRTSGEIRRQRPGWDLFRDGCPQGEMPNQVLARADRVIARLRRLDGNIALFSHGQFGGVLAARWLGLPLPAARHFPLDTASVSILGVDPHHPDVSVLTLWNSLTHLAGNHRFPDSTIKARALQRWENEGGKVAVAGLQPALATEG